jgi:hypothetical protein
VTSRLLNQPDWFRYKKNRDQFIRSFKHFFSELSARTNPNKVRIFDGFFQSVAFQRSFMIIDVGITRCIESIDGVLV